MIRFITCVFCCIVLLFSLIIGQDTSQVDAGFDNGFGARAKGLGFAQTAFSTDSTAVFWNPSLLHKNKSSNTLLERQAHFGQYTSFFLAHTQLFSDFALGAGHYQVSIGDIVKTDAIGDRLGTASFGLSRSMIGVSTSLERFHSLFTSTHFGIVYDQYKQNLVDNKGSAGIINLGFHYEFNSSFMFGVSYFNVLGSPFSWNTASKIKEAIPQKLSFGVSYSDSDYAIALDVLKKSDQELKFHLGVEKDIISFYHLNFLGRLGLQQDKFTLGLGLQLAAFKLDYAYQAKQESYLENSHYLTFSYWFDYDRKFNKEEEVVDDSDNNYFSDEIVVQIEQIKNTDDSLAVAVFDEIAMFPMEVPSLSTVVLLDEKEVSQMIKVSPLRKVESIATENLFTDLIGHWVELVATEFHQMDWIKGEELFIPNRAITRYEFAEQLVKVFQVSSEKRMQLSISDIEKEDSRYPVVNLVSQKGLFILDSQNNFRPLSFITRAEAMAVIFRLTDLSYIDGVDFPFTDVPEGYWARFYIELGLNHDIVMFNDKFYPKRPLSRAEMIGLFSRTPEVIDRINDRLY